MVVPGHHSWVGLRVTSLHWKLTWYLLVPCGKVLREEAFRSVPAQEHLGSVSEVLVPSAIGLFFHLWGSGEDSNIRYVLGVSCTILPSNSKGSCPACVPLLISFHDEWQCGSVNQTNPSLPRLLLVTAIVTLRHLLPSSPTRSLAPC